MSRATESTNGRGAVDPRHLSDEEIIARVQEGDVHCFTWIFERHYSRLSRFARHLGVPAADLEDVLAEIFTRALARVSSFDAAGGSRYVSYLYAVARNLITDRRRERGRTPEMLGLDAAHDLPDRKLPDPEQLLLHRDQLVTIRKAMERLGPSDRMIITLSYDCEMTCREIMDVMEKPSVSAVTTHLYKAMKRLRQQVQELESPAGCRASSGV